MIQKYLIPQQFQTALLPVINQQQIEYVDDRAFHNATFCRANDVSLESSPVETSKPGNLLSTGIAQLCATELLNADEETRLFELYNFARFQTVAQIRALKKNTEPTEAELVEIKSNWVTSLEYRNRIVEANMRLVISIARTFVRPSLAFDDLISEGIFPLIRAVELFDYTRGWKFSTYASHCVRNRLTRISEQHSRHRKQQAHWSDAMVDHLCDERSPFLDPEPILEEQETVMETLLEELTPREQTVLAQRYGLDSDKPKSFEQISRKLDLSKERVRQISHAALAKLQCSVEDQHLDYPEPCVLQPARVAV